jgi:hypothetical protein
VTAPLPRTYRAFHTRNGLYAYRVRTAATPTWPMEEPAYMSDTRVLEAQGYAGYAHGDLTGNGTPTREELDALTADLVDQATHRLGRGLHRDDRLAMAGEDPTLTVEVRVTVRVGILGWPKEPGVTTMPYQPIGDPVPASTDFDRLYGMWQHATLDHWRVVWLHHPHLSPGRTLPEYFTLVPHPDIPYGYLRLAVELA